MHIWHSFLFTLHPDQPPAALLLVSGPSCLLALTGAVASRTTAAATSQLLAGSKLAVRLATEGAAGWQFLRLALQLVVCFDDVKHVVEQESKVSLLALHYSQLHIGWLGDEGTGFVHLADCDVGFEFVQ